MSKSTKSGFVKPLTMLNKPNPNNSFKEMIREECERKEFKTLVERIREDEVRLSKQGRLLIDEVLSLITEEARE